MELGRIGLTQSYWQIQSFKWLTFPLCVHGQDSCGIQAKYP
jgi:hypothetical protein